uniref:Uncharacterized protein n=1 Tax=mine drainage metagenome TaxID=410659 RepID=E6QJE0_9ZZZZ
MDISIGTDAFQFTGSGRVPRRRWSTIAASMEMLSGSGIAGASGKRLASKGDAYMVVPHFKVSEPLVPQRFLHPENLTGVVNWVYVSACGTKGAKDFTEAHGRRVSCQITNLDTMLERLPVDHNHGRRITKIGTSGRLMTPSRISPTSTRTFSTASTIWWPITTT